MCAEWHADARDYFLWQPLLVVLWLCTTSPNIGQPTLYIANPQPCVILSNMSPPLHYFPNTGQCLTLAPAVFPHKFVLAAQTEICCGGSASHLAQVVPSARQPFLRLLHDDDVTMFES